MGEGQSLGVTTNYDGNCDGCTRNSRIDYMFFSKDASSLVLKGAEIIDTRDSSGAMPSDHKPMVATLDVKQQRGGRPPRRGLTPTPGGLTPNVRPPGS